MKLDSLWVQRLMVGIALSVFGAATVFNFYAEHVRVMQREQDRLLTQTYVIEENINQNLISVDNVLKDIQKRDHGQFGKEEFTNYLKTLVDAMPSVRTLLVIDHNGQALASSRPELMGVNFEERAYFHAVRRHPDKNILYVSTPYRTILGVYAINVSRMLSDSQGRFQGVVTATLDPQFFSILLDSVRYAPDISVNLAHWEGDIFLTLPKPGDMMSKNMLDQGEFFNAHRSSGKDVTVSPVVKYKLRGDRMVVQRTINPENLRLEEPLVVEIDRGIDEIYASWRSDVLFLGSLYIFIFVASTFGLLVYQRKQKKMDAMEAAAIHAIKSSEHFMKMITDHMPAMVAYWSSELRCRFANSAYLEWFGRMPEEMINMRMQDLLGEELFRKNEIFIRGALRGERQQFERTLIKANGSTGYTWAQYIPDVENDRVNGFFVLVSDVTPLKEAQMALAESEWKLRTIIQEEPECITVLTLDGKIQQINPAGLAMIGAGSEPQAIGAGFDALIAPESKMSFGTLLEAVGQGDSRVATLEIIGFTGAARWLECHAVPMRDRSEHIVGALCVMRDITDQRKAEKELEYLARTDFLSGLANRRHFMAQAEQELQRTYRYGGTLAILMMDIDFFKKINDTHGHKCGDAVIRKVGELCRTTLRSLDVIGRLGGEEFAVLLPETDRNHAMEVAELLRQRVSQAEVHTDNGEAIRFTISIGVTSSDPQETDLDTLLANADQALYEAKNTGRNKVCIYWKADDM